MKALFFLLSVALQSPSPVGAQDGITASSAGLDMVPARCSTEDRRQIATENLVVLRNKVISFRMGGVTLRSELDGADVHVWYSDEEGRHAFFHIGALIRYRASDVRLYHAILDGRPVVLWEETVENVSGRAGIVEYRGRAMFPVCDGLIRAINREANVAR